MNKIEKTEFIIEITNNLKTDILSRINSMPEDWNGFEIRQFISDYYNENYISKGKLTGLRLKEYFSECRKNNLFID